MFMILTWGNGLKPAGCYDMMSSIELLSKAWVYQTRDYDNESFVCKVYKLSSSHPYASTYDNTRLDEMVDMGCRGLPRKCIFLSVG